MANNCYFHIKAVGKKPNLERFLGIVQCDYRYGNDGSYNGTSDKHFFRVWADDAPIWEKENNGNCSIEIFGDCAWSVCSCMTEGDGTYYSSLYSDKYKTHATTLKQESKDLNLQIEVFSEESGIGFQEHYLYKNGEELINDCVDYSSFYIEEYETKEEAEKELEETFTDEEWKYAKENNEDIIRGGFDSWNFTI